MKRSAFVVTLIFALLIGACAFGATTAGLMITQPAVPGANQTIEFQVQSGDTSSAIATRLQQQGLIRNATVFGYYAKFKKLDAGLKQGTVELRANMSMDQIIAALQAGGSTPQIVVKLPENSRVSEYPPYFKDMKKFNADNFTKIVTTGKYNDGSDVSKKYWFVAPLHTGAKFALEGYLYPDTYDFDPANTEEDVVNRLLDEFGTFLCPGPDGQSDMYFRDQAQCIAHGVTVDVAKKTSIFTAATTKYYTTDVVEGLYRALTLASIVSREARDTTDMPVVTNALYNRYAVSAGKLIGAADSLGVDATAWYARDTDTPPTDGKYWSDKDATGAPLDASTTDAASLYNTRNVAHRGLTPGPIAAPLKAYLAAAAYPNPDGATPYFFYVHDACDPSKIHTAVTLAQHNANKAKYVGKCPAA